MSKAIHKGLNRALAVQDPKIVLTKYKVRPHRGNCLKQIEIEHKINKCKRKIRTEGRWLELLVAVWLERFLGLA